VTAPRHNLDQLLVFDTIIRAGSFAAAAKALHRVPSAVTYAIRNLEEALDLKLFEKKGRKSVLTAEGHRVLEQVRAVLGQARSLDRLADHLGGKWEASVHVVADGALPMTSIVKGVQRFLARGLPTRVRLDIECQDGVLERFERDHAELMLTLDFDRELGTYALTRLPSLEMVLVASPTHPLTQRDRLDKEMLTSHLELVVRDTAPRFVDNPRASFLGTEHVIYLPDFHAKRLALIEGTGFGWTPHHIVDEDMRAGRLQPIDLVDGNRWTYQPRLVHRSTEPLGPAGMQLATDLKEAFWEGRKVEGRAGEDQ
jgi:DNA-binding transcriptional LysR family regulator